jgi:hypothetical protein
MTHEHAGSGFVQDDFRRRDIVLERRFRLLDNLHGIAVTFQDFGDRLPARAVGEGAVNKHDRLDFGLRRSRRTDERRSGKREIESFHGNLPLEVLR